MLDNGLRVLHCQMIRWWWCHDECVHAGQQSLKFLFSIRLFFIHLWFVCLFGWSFIAISMLLQRIQLKLFEFREFFRSKQMEKCYHVQRKCNKNKNLSSYTKYTQTHAHFPFCVRWTLQQSEMLLYSFCVFVDGKIHQTDFMSVQHSHLIIATVISNIFIKCTFLLHFPSVFLLHFSFIFCRSQSFFNFWLSF